MPTVFVKIAVAVDPEGKWNAVGFSNEGTLGAPEAMEFAVEGVGDGEARYWLTAILHVPEETEVVARTVEPDTSKQLS